MASRVEKIIHSYMTHIARTENELITYSEIIEKAEIYGHGSGITSKSLGNLLYQVIQYDREQDSTRPMLSAIAVAKASNHPSRGFYQLAKDLEYITSIDRQEDFWRKELGALRKYWREHSETKFRGNTITYSAIYDAIQDFDQHYPNTNDYDRWLENGIYEYALDFMGKLYPPKYILSVVTKTDISLFSGGEQTIRVFQQLGLVIVDKPSNIPEQPPISRATYLLTWNPRKSTWGNFQEDWENVYAGNRPRFEWSCGNTRRIRVGDRVFMMRLGWREKVTGIIASGWITGEPIEDEHWTGDGRAALYVEFEPDVLLNPETDELFDPRIVSQDFNWTPQSSGTTIPSDISSQLEEKWQLHVQAPTTLELQTQHESDSQPSFVEGARKLVTSYRYERDPRARAECIKTYGAKCVVCGFDFEKEFGQIGKDFIHVHHLTPISEREAEYTIVPTTDLRPVCPNCHAMLHRQSPPFSIDDLIKIRQAVKADQ